METPALESVKREFRKTYQEFISATDGYDCGLSLTLHVSGRARDLVGTMIGQLERMVEIDPDCPGSVLRQIESWRKALGSPPSEREEAIRELIS